ncbi:GntR family transcriptional regulator [Thalassotalea sp. SU-HH00458]|uniref:GntR family transcriptional regulator n=1 Tax=Thalassotalea sp. SU-HH00458 TaxID=3127657 RepID=UPI003103C732
MLDSAPIVSVRDQIAQQLRADIINGVLMENTKLKEQELAKRFGVSRGPVRDVLLQLSKEGLLVSKNNCGVSVNSSPKEELQPLMIETRINIETFAMKLVVNELDDDDFSKLEDLLSKLNQAFTDENYFLVTEIDMAFHRFFVHKAGGDDLVNLWQPFIYRMRMNYKRLTNAQECYDEHKTILDAMKAKDIKTAISALKGNIK